MKIGLKGLATKGGLGGGSKPLQMMKVGLMGLASNDYVYMPAKSVMAAEHMFVQNLPASIIPWLHSWNTVILSNSAGRH